MDALIAELRKPEYQGLTDAQAAAAVNSKTVVVRTHIDCWIVKQHAMESGYWAKVRMAAKDATLPLQVQELAITAIDWITQQEHLDVDRDATRQLIGGLVASGLMNQVQADGLIGLAESNKPWVDVVGLGRVCDGAVRQARSQIR